MHINRLVLLVCIHGHFLLKYLKRGNYQMENQTFCDNAIIHYYPLSPYVAKCDLHLRRGNSIVLRTCLRDDDVAKEFLRTHFCGVPAKTIVHC